MAGKKRRRPVETYTPAEIDALISACSHRAPTGVRNRALIAVLYRGALRIGEALALFPKDVDLETGEVRILHGKGDKSRLIRLDRDALAMLQRWMDRRATLGANGRHPLFCTLKRGAVSPEYCRQLFPRLAKKAGVEKRVHPHGFRHTFACEWVREGRDLHQLRRILGHSSLTVTDRYLEGIGPTAALEAMASREWRSNGRPPETPPERTEHDGE